MGIFDGFKNPTWGKGKGIFGGFTHQAENKGAAGAGNWRDRLFGPSRAAPPAPPTSAPEEISQGERLAQVSRGFGKAFENLRRGLKHESPLPMRTCSQGHPVLPGNSTCTHGHYVG